MTFKNKALTAAAVIFLLLIFDSTSWAIPVFARKYKTSCVTCHSVFPKLNPFGDAFRRNGYRIPNADERYVKEKPVTLGSPAWKEAWPDGVWPGEIPEMPPLSLSADFVYQYDDRAAVEHDFTAPDELELLTGGTFGSGISFFGGIELIDNGKEFGGVDRLFIQFNNLFNKTLPERLLNLTLGQFKPSVIPASYQHRLTHTPHLSNTLKVGKNDFHFTKQRGIELSGIAGGRFDYAAGIVNGNNARLDSSSRSSDNNGKKDVYLKVGYKIGGLGLDGSDIESAETNALSGSWHEKSLYINAFGYAGENRIAANNNSFDDSFFRYGLSLNLNYDRFNLTGAAMRADHKNPNGDSRKESAAAYSIEADATFFPWLIGALRRDLIDKRDSEDTDEIVAALVALIHANIKLTLEGKFHASGDNNDLAFIKLDFAI